MEFSRQECWSGLPFPSPGHLPNPGIKPRSPTLQADALPSEPRGKPQISLDNTVYPPGCSTSSFSKSYLLGILSKPSDFLPRDLFPIILPTCVCLSWGLADLLENKTNLAFWEVPSHFHRQHPCFWSFISSESFDCCVVLLWGLHITQVRLFMWV